MIRGPTRIPSCYQSNPSPQAQAENDCRTCPMRRGCVGVHVPGVHRPNGTSVRALRDKTGMGMAECRRHLKTKWRRAKIDQLKEMLIDGTPDRNVLRKIVEFLEFADLDYSREEE